MAVAVDDPHLIAEDPAGVVVALYRARSQGDLDAARRILHPDVVWREHEGEAGYAGVHHGRDAVIEDMLAAAMQATGGTFEVRLDDVIAHGPSLAVALVVWSATRDGERRTGREVAVYRVVEGRVVEASFQLDDPDATDAFFAGPA
jgi:ketosteroid isomerase-like protein